MINTNIYLEEKSERLLFDANCYLLPISVEKCVHFLNISLKALDLDEDVSGFLILKEDTAHIGINKSNSRQRKRFTIAHEIGHYLLHAKSSKLFIDKKEKILYRNTNSSTGESLREIEANAFAASLLMPRKLILQELEIVTNVTEGKFIKALAKKFDVSEQAITIRLTNLGLIDYSAFAS